MGDTAAVQFSVARNSEGGHNNVCNQYDECMYIVLMCISPFRGGRYCRPPWFCSPFLLYAAPVRSRPDRVNGTPQILILRSFNIYVWFQSNCLLEKMETFQLNPRIFPSKLNYLIVFHFSLKEKIEEMIREYFTPSVWLGRGLE